MQHSQEQMCFLDKVNGAYSNQNHWYHTVREAAWVEREPGFDPSYLLMLISSQGQGRKITPEVKDGLFLHLFE